MVRVLMVPGLTGSGPGHWQSLWQERNKSYGRVDQRDWEHPEVDEWVESLDRAVRDQSQSIVLVGHSLGSITIVHWAARLPTSNVVGAVVVAPTDVEAESAPIESRGFSPIPLKPLLFPSRLVSSKDDHLLDVERARHFARCWGSELVALDKGGHFNTASGYGPWPDGCDQLQEFVASSEGVSRQSERDG